MARCRGSGASGRAFQLSVLAVLGFGIPYVAFIYIDDVKARQLVATSAVVSLLGFLATKWLIPKVSFMTPLQIVSERARERYIRR
jgi:hypothetical protein